MAEIVKSGLSFKVDEVTLLVLDVYIKKDAVGQWVTMVQLQRSEKVKRTVVEKEWKEFKGMLQAHNLIN